MAKWTYFHNIDPFIIQFTDNFGLRWYSMAYIVGFFVGYYLITRLIKKNISPLSTKSASDFVVWVAFGAILGGRLGYAVFYAPDILLEFDSHFPYWETLKIHHGGLASHGGIIGLVVSTVWFAKRRGFSPYHCLDLTVLGGLGVFFGRIANFINGELFGRVIEGKTLWAVQFPQEMLSWVAQKKMEALEGLSPAVSKIKSGMSADMWREWVYQLESNGSYKSQIYSVIHSLIESCEKGNKEVISALKEVLPLRHPSQLYQAFLEGLFPFLVVLFLFNKKKLKSGIISAVWALSYVFMRISGEQFREPDAHLGFRALGLTRGQWLSVFMLLCILVYFVLILKRQKSDSG